MRMPPAMGPMMTGKRRTRDWTPIPMARLSAGRLLATRVKVAGSESVLQARNRKAAASTAAQCWMSRRRTYPAIDSKVNPPRAFL